MPKLWQAMRLEAGNRVVGYGVEIWKFWMSGLVSKCCPVRGHQHRHEYRAVRPAGDDAQLQHGRKTPWTQKSRQSPGGHIGLVFFRVIDICVGVDVLYILIVFQGVQQLDDSQCVLAFYTCHGLGKHAQLG